MQINRVATLSRDEIRYLIRVLEREVNTCGLDTPAGKSAFLMKERLKQMLCNISAILQAEHDS